MQNPIGSVTKEIDAERVCELTFSVHVALPTLKAMKQAYIKTVLDRCNGHKTKAAKILGISRKSLYRMHFLRDSNAEGT